MLLDGVRFVIVDGVEVGAATMRRRVVVHAAVLGLLTCVLAALAWRRGPPAAPGTDRADAAA